MTEQNHLIVLRRRPSGQLRPDDLDVVVEAIPEPGPGEMLVRNLWLSIDPSTRILLSETTPRGYLPPFALDEPLSGLALGTVVASRSADFAPGDIVTHAQGFREYALIDTESPATLGGYGGVTLLRPGDVPLEWYLGPLGSSGLTAYAGITEILAVEPGDVVWVSAAAGAVGSIAAQLAKLRGAEVIGSAGGPQKVEYLRGLGLTEAFDHKARPVAESLAEVAPDGIDKYFDNVGADHLTAAISALRHRGRIALCGAIADYDTEAPVTGPPNMFELVAKDARVEGFRAGTFVHLEPEVCTELADHLAAGRLTWRSRVFEGIGEAPAALISMLAGAHIGKTLCRLT